MKRTITAKQWFGETTKDQRKTFLKASPPRVEGFPSIGDMIVFLEKKHAIRCEQWMDEYRAWRVGLDWWSRDEYEYVVEKKELCDALWFAVKYVLEETEN